MKFCSKEQNENEIIKNINMKKDMLVIEYMNGKQKRQFNITKNDIKEIENLMIEQAKERDSLDYVESYVHVFGTFINYCAAICVSTQCQDNLLLFFCIIFVVAKLLKKHATNIYKICELKKYRILLNNYELMKNNVEASKAVEKDNYYTIPVDIFHADQFSLGDMQTIKRKLKQIKEK